MHAQSEAMVHAGSDGGHGARRDFSARRTIGQDVADMLAMARRSRGWSLRQAARRVGVTPSMIVHLEKARRAPSALVAEDIIDAYQLPDDSAELLMSAAVPDAGRSYRGQSHKLARRR